MGENKNNLIITVLIVIIVILSIYIWKDKSSQEKLEPILGNATTTIGSSDRVYDFSNREVMFSKEIVWEDYQNEELGITFKYPPQTEIETEIFEDEEDFEVKASIDMFIQFGETPQRESSGEVRIVRLDGVHISIELSDCTDSPTSYKNFVTTRAGDIWKMTSNDEIHKIYFLKYKNVCYHFIAQKADPVQYQDESEQLIKNIFESIRFTY